MKIEDIQKQRGEWKRKAWAIPEFRGKKQDWFAIVVELVLLLDRDSVADQSNKIKQKNSGNPSEC